MKKYTQILSLAAFASFAFTAGSASAANMISNGDFETGDLTGWTIGPTGGNSIDNTTPLAGSYSALQVNQGNDLMSQVFTAFTDAATTSFIFAASDPGGANDRSMNVTFGGNGQSQINLRVVDLDDDGDGDVQAYNGAWTTVLTDAVTFGSTTTFALTINGYGAGFNYDLNVGGNIASGLTDVQDGVLNYFNKVRFVNSSLATGSTFEFDNVVVIPEPGTYALLAGLTGLVFVMLRRR